ncbi:hypothetical protein [Chryseobacterium sp. G0201]|uniref:hypothetical protein n=1 Tax=Chryseobacterium sp. G0201 TaxID=2487065 RepID=UPI000F4E7E33|nr:hypothetical protein [Chryseobacterium sp. G0201]AZA53537.1 hypothetical protein EG348_11215 [Chryseobacterium sp. G0201]
MKNKITLTLALIVGGIAQAQVGFNTTTPKATIDIVAKSTTGATPEGLLVPRVSRQKAQTMTGVETSTLIYVNDIAGTAAGSGVNINAVGYYYFNGTLWVKTDNDNNIYNTNGNLTGNRTVNQVGNTLAFTSTATTGTSHFSVDGTTLNVDARNNRIGMGTAAPETILDINGAGAGFQHTNGTVKLRSFLGTDYASFGTVTNQRLSFVANNAFRMTIAADGKVGIGTQTPNNLLDLGSSNGKKLAIWNSAAGDDFYGFGNAANVLQLFAGASATGNALMTLNKNGNVGVGTISPQTNFHTIGTRRFENTTAGTVAVGSVLTATDANGTAEWKTPVAEAVVGALTGDGIDIPFAGNGDYRYTGRYITLPPGRWAVTVTQLAQTLGALDTDDWMFVRSTFTDQNVAVGAVATRSGDVNGGPSLMSFRVQGPASAAALQQFDVYQGAVFINNTSGANKIYRYIVGSTVVGGGPNSATVIKNFGGSWSESSIYATAIK